jgi:hypothetical protein
MANLATMSLKDTLAVLRAREAKVITTCCSAWWADRQKFEPPSNASPTVLSGRPWPARAPVTWLHPRRGGMLSKRAPPASTIAEGLSGWSRSSTFVDGREIANDGLVAAAVGAR